MPKTYSISRTAEIDKKGFSIGPRSRIRAGAKIGEHIVLGSGILVGADATLYGYSYIDDDVTIGPRTQVDLGALILNGAAICPNDVYSMSSNARQLYPNVSIGCGVVLDNEAELGEDAIIPTQRTVAFLGKFGIKNRVVTIYGSDDGPLYSVGCQVGIDLSTFKGRVAYSTCSTPTSANTYQPYMSVFDEIGTQVQRAYETEDRYIEEIKAMREELIPKYE